MSRVPFALLAKRLLLGLLFAFVMAFPLAAVMAWGALITVALGASLPLWAVLLIASLVAVGIVAFFVAGQGNSVMEIMIGSIIALVMAWFLWPGVRDRQRHSHSKTAIVHWLVRHTA